MVGMSQPTPRHEPSNEPLGSTGPRQRVPPGNTPQPPDEPGPVPHGNASHEDTRTHPESAARTAPGPLRGHYEYRVLDLPRAFSHAETRQILTDHAEYGQWELDRVRLHRSGARKVRLRRRIIRVTRAF
jgi:hypothetical protein